MSACGKRQVGLALIVAFAGGCAAGGKQAPAAAMAPPASPADARRELSLLEQQIRANRVALGLSVPERERPEKSAAGAAPAEEPADHAPAAPRMPSPPPAPAARLAPDAEESVGVSGRTPGGTGGRYTGGRQPAQSDEDSCAPNCRYTKAICHAADRICGLARYLREADATRRCERARSDCKEARKATEGENCDDCG